MGIFDLFKKNQEENKEKLVYVIYGEHATYGNVETDKFISGDRYIIDYEKRVYDENETLQDEETLGGFLNEVFISNDKEVIWEEDYGENTTEFINSRWEVGEFKSEDEAIKFLKEIEIPKLTESNDDAEFKTDDQKISKTYDENGIRHEGERNFSGNKIGLWKTFKTQDGGKTEYLTCERVWTLRKGLEKIGITGSSSSRFYYQNGNLSRTNFPLEKNSDDYKKAFEKTNSEQVHHITTEYFENGNVRFEKISVNHDDNCWFETTYNDKGGLTSKGWVKNGIRDGEWEFLNSEKKYFFPIVVDIISDDTKETNHSDHPVKGDKIVFSLSDDSFDLKPKINTQVVVWNTIHSGDVNRGYPFGEGKLIIDLKNSVTPDSSKSDFVKILSSKESNCKIEINSHSNITKIDRLSTSLGGIMISDIPKYELDKTTYHKNGNVKTEFIEIDGVNNGDFNSYFENGEMFKCQKFNNGNLIYIEEYHLNGTLVRKGSIVNSHGVEEWEYYDSKTGKQVNRQDYERNWFANLPEEFKYFETKDEDAKNGLDKFWQVCEYNVIVYKNDKVVAEGYIEFEIYENTWVDDVSEYDREGEGSVLIIDGQKVDHEEFDNVELVTEREMERYSDFSYAKDAFDMLIDGMTSE